jgi:hypothetical protein
LLRKSYCLGFVVPAASRQCRVEIVRSLLKADGFGVDDGFFPAEAKQIL